MYVRVPSKDSKILDGFVGCRQKARATTGANGERYIVCVWYTYHDISVSLVLSPTPNA